MKPAPFEYFAPSSVATALRLLKDVEQCRPLAGGQSLVPMMAARLARPAALVDLNRISELSQIAERGGTLILGSMSRQSDVLESEQVTRSAPLLIETLANVGHPATRARGTIGGSAANADPAAELPVALVALGARFLIANLEGERFVDAAEFFRGMFETAIAENELLTEIHIPREEGSSAFLEVSRRKGDFAIASVAVRLKLDRDRKCERFVVVFGGMRSVPTRCEQVEQELIGRYVDSQAITRAVAAIPADLVDLDNSGVSSSYRHYLAEVLLARSLRLALSRQVVP
jgi:carbon-monoxide dehydrogenase medium subunit